MQPDPSVFDMLKPFYILPPFPNLCQKSLKLQSGYGATPSLQQSYCLLNLSFHQNLSSFDQFETFNFFPQFMPTINMLPGFMRPLDTIVPSANAFEQKNWFGRMDLWNQFWFDLLTYLQIDWKISFLWRLSPLIFKNFGCWANLNRHF